MIRSPLLFFCYVKMRRTRGIEEFEFEEYEDDYGDKRKLAVVIMVSGWMIEKEDYRKTYGVVPREMPLEERLKRFYELHCPLRLVVNRIVEIIWCYYINDMLW